VGSMPDSRFPHDHLSLVRGGGYGEAEV
jgi:hypothetical protein